MQDGGSDQVSLWMAQHSLWRLMGITLLGILLEAVLLGQGAAVARNVCY